MYHAEKTIAPAVRPADNAVGDATAILRGIGRHPSPAGTRAGLGVPA